MKKLLCLLLALWLPAYALAESLPMVVSVALTSDTVKVEGRNIKAAGVGRRAPWGIHEADVIYETMLYETGQTRLGCVFQSSCPSAAGPVRSSRAAHYYLREEWNAALIFAGNAGMVVRDAIQDDISFSSPLVLDNHRSRFLRAFTSRQKGVKAPDNLSVNLTGLHNALNADESERPFSIRTDRAASSDERLNELTLDWGNDEFETRSIYSSAENIYYMYRRNAPFLSYPSAQREPERAVQLAFSAIIIQYMNYDWPSPVMPLAGCVGSGTADFLIGGRIIHGRWERPTVSSPTRYWDDTGQEQMLPPGKLYIAQFPTGAEINITSDHMTCAHQP